MTRVKIVFFKKVFANTLAEETCANQQIKNLTAILSRLTMTEMIKEVKMIKCESGNMSGDGASCGYVTTDCLTVGQFVTEAVAKFSKGEALLKVETFSREIWEPAAGLLHISKTLKEHGHRVRSSDIEARCEGVEEKDFLFMDCERWHGDIITNPPYSTAGEFVLKSLQSVEEGAKVAMLLRLLFLEGQQRRREIFENPPPPIRYMSSAGARYAPKTAISAYTRRRLSASRGSYGSRVGKETRP